ncbi:MAG: FtsQ-type POTRA domain-containing protein [Clostridiales Family XIII bacterium]|jgi:cell division protein FtsQ|nr:FtsQ-type POTRA domain-containing protein [Clostridiales Family XIII bacterium]
MGGTGKGKARREGEPPQNPDLNAALREMEERSGAAPEPPYDRDGDMGEPRASDVLDVLDALDEGQGQKPKKKKKKRKKKRYLLKFFIFCLAAAALYYFVNSSFFDVRAIAVEGNEYYTSEQIIEKAGVKAGNNIFREDLTGVKRALMEDPYIISARVRRDLPGTLAISVNERKEAAFLKDGKYAIIIDENGLALRKSETAPMLTELTNLDVTAAEEGKALEVEQNAAFADALALMRAADAGGLYFKRIDVSGIVVRAHVYDHLICEGTTENLIGNMARTKSLLEQLDGQGIQRGTLKVGSDRYIAWQPAEE